MAKQREEVEILISAQDKASAKFEQARKALDKNVQGVKELGGRAKASSELVGTLANTMGSGWISQATGQFAQLTERISAFSEMQKQGTAGALAFKAGILAAAGALGYQLGIAIAKIINDFKGFQAEVARTIESLNFTSGRLVKGIGDKFAFERERIGLIIDPDEQKAALQKLGDQSQAEFEKLFAEAAAAKKELEAMRSNVSFFGGQSDAYKEEIKLQEARTRALEQQRDLLMQQRDEVRYQLSDQHKHLEAMREKKKLHEEGLAAQQRATEQAEREAEAAQKRAEADAQREKERIEGVYGNLHDQIKLQVLEMQQGKEAALAYQLQLQGLEEADAQQAASTLTELERIRTEAAKEKRRGPVGVSATEDRFSAGRTVTIDYTKKTADSNEEIAKKTREMTDKLLPRVIQVLEMLEVKMPEFEVA